MALRAKRSMIGLMVMERKPCALFTPWLKLRLVSRGGVHCGRTGSHTILMAIQIQSCGLTLIQIIIWIQVRVIGLKWMLTRAMLYRQHAEKLGLLYNNFVK